jgi:hypothetical protein
MKRLLLLIGITTTLGLVNAGAQTNAEPRTSPDAPTLTACSPLDDEECNADCRAAGCDFGVCNPPCICFYNNDERCP